MKGWVGLLFALQVQSAAAGLAEDMAALREQPEAALKRAAQQCEDKISVDHEATREAVRLGMPLAQAPSRERAWLLICRGFLAEISGQLRPALADFQSAVKAAEAAGATEERAQALAMRGEVQQRLGAYDAALADLQAAHRLAATGGDTQMYALNAIANFYSDPLVGQYAEALKYFRQLHAAHVAAGRQDDAATTLFNEASTLQRLDRPSEAEALFRRALAAYEAQQDRASVGETLRALAALLSRQNRPAEALPLADRALRVAESLNDTELRMTTLMTRGLALRRLGRLREAEASITTARAYFQQQGALRFQASATGELAEVAAAKQQWQRAFALRSEQVQLEETLRASQQQELSSRLRIQFDVARMEEQTASAQREAELRQAALRDADRIRQLQWALIGAGALLAAGVAAWAWRALRRARRFASLAYSDALTGIPNRRSIIERLDAALAAGKRVQVLMADIDHFKRINDTRGHEAGDTVLRTVAQALQTALGAEGALGRLGGEEFLVLAPEGDLATLAERLRATVESLRWPEPLGDLRVTMSLGAARALPQERRSESLLQRADAALYEAKAQGRNRVGVARD